MQTTEEARFAESYAVMLPPILFAADTPPAPLSDASKHAGTRNDPGRPRVLVVDDEPLIATTVAAILNDNGFEAAHAFSAEDALTLVHDFCPDIVLSDVLMPRISGIELGVRLHQELPAAHVILFSGQAATTELLRKARRDGFEFELLPKPIHPEELIARLRGVKLPRT